MAEVAPGPISSSADSVVESQPASESPLPGGVHVNSIDAFMRQTTATVDKYRSLFEQIQDVASAEKAAAEMRSLSAQLQALTAALASIPYDSRREVELITQLADTPLRVHTDDSMRVMNDPQLGPLVAAEAAHFLRVWKAYLAEFIQRQRAHLPQ